MSAKIDLSNKNNWVIYQYLFTTRDNPSNHVYEFT